MARLLITGAAGFIGANFTDYWLAKYPEDRVVALDSLTYSGNLANLYPVQSRPKFRFVQGDILDTPMVEALLREEGIDTLVHFAAESHVDRSISGPEVFIQTNVVGTHSLLRAVRHVWLGERAVAQHRFHHISTDEVYGSLELNDPAFTESTPYAPNSPYAASKAASDHLVRAYHKTYGLQTTISNCSNNYGPYQFPEKLIPLIIVNLLRGKSLPVYGDGCNIRDWLHVEDHCRGVDAILQDGTPGEVYNIGSRNEWTNIRLVTSLCEIADDLFARRPDLRALYPACPPSCGVRAADLITYVQDRPGHDLRYATDCTRMETKLGFRALIPLPAGLVRTFEWYVGNAHWWRNVLEGRHRGCDSSASPSHGRHISVSD